MEIVTSQDTRLLEWAEAKLETKWDKSQVRWIAGVDSSVVFVLIYSRFSKRGCELTIATDGTKRWATRRSLRVIFGLPFNYWGLKRVTFVIKADNSASLDMVQRLGAVVEGRIRKAFDGDVDGIVLGLLKEESRWQ